MICPAALSTWPDFGAAERAFRRNGWEATEFGEAIWRFRRPRAAARHRILLTAAVHGDETAPVELLARRLPAWAEAAHQLNVELCVALGNLAAMAAGVRYIDHDMNRMFAQGTAYTGPEAQRAALLRDAIEAMMGEHGCTTLHLDLHTTIRASLKPKFAIVPHERPAVALMRWLAGAGLDAAVLNPGRHATLSGFTSWRGAASCTVELGTVAAFGANDLTPFALFEEKLDALVRDPAGAWTQEPQPAAMPVYRVTAEIVRRSERFELLVPDTAPNFTPLQRGQLVARDRLDTVYARHDGECLVFPNPKVALGLRAGLLVAPVEAPRV